jgi:hypothetical protein
MYMPEGTPNENGGKKMTVIRAAKQTMTRTERMLDGSLLPGNNGERTLTRGLYLAKRNGSAIPMLGGFDNCLWDKDLADISDAAVRDGYTTLHIADESTALMGNLHALAKLGWTLGQPAEISGADEGSGLCKKAIMVIPIHKEAK